MPAAGQGSISFSQKAEPAGAPGPPFAPTSADNGLSVDPITGRIVLGNDVGSFLAQLLNDREIPLNNFIFELVNDVAGNKQFSVDPVNRLYRLGDIDGVGNNFFLSIDDTNEDIGIGDYNNFISSVVNIRGNLGGTQNPLVDLWAPLLNGDYAQLSVFCNPMPTQSVFADRRGSTTQYLEQRIQADSFDLFHLDAINTRKRLMFLDYVNSLYQFGDIETLLNGTSFSIDDANQLAQILFGADPYLLLDLANNQYAFGDFNNFVNPVMDMYGGANPSIGRTVQTGGFAISVNEGMGINGGIPSYQNFLEGGANDVTFRYSDELFTFFTGQGAGTVGKVLADLANNDYGIGDGFPGDPGGQNNNGTALYINDAAQTVEIYSNGMRRSVLVNASAYNVALGDIDGNNNLLILEVDDANNRVEISNTGNNALVRMNGVNGFTGTVSPVNSITVNGGIVTAVS